MSARNLLPLAVAVLIAGAGCGPGPAGGAPAFEIGTGGSSFQAVLEGATVPIVRGPQGGIHVWVAGRVRGLGDPVDVHYGLRDADTGESLSYLALEAMLHPTPGGDEDTFAGLAARFVADDPAAYDGRRLIVWARVEGQGFAVSDERTIVAHAP